MDLTTIAKTLLYVGAIVSWGEVVLPGLAAERTRARRVWHIVAAIALTIAPLLWLFAQLQALDMPWASVRTLLTDTAWGRQWIPFAIACGLAALPLEKPNVAAARPLLFFGAIALAITMGGLGHANADEAHPIFARVIDASHVAAMGAWIGGLLLAVADGGSTGHDRRKRTWRTMSRIAAFAAPLAVLTGLLGAGRILFGIEEPAPLSAMIASPYVRMLLVKSLAVFAMLTLGALQRRRIARGDLPTDNAVRLELLLASGVTVLTAVLTGSEPPG